MKFIKSSLNTILRYSKYILFFWISLVGFPYIYIEQLGKYTNFEYTFSAFFVLGLFYIYYTEHNRVLNRMYWGSALSSFLLVELFFFLLFAQYYFLIAVVVLLSALPIGFFLFKLFLKDKPEKSRSFKYVEFCRKKAGAALCCIMAVVLLIPSGMGLYEEYIDVTDDKAWAEFVASYNSKAEESEAPVSLFEANRETLAKINDWDKLKKDERIELIQKIGIIEEEYLGLSNHAEVIITTDKLPEYEYGNYVNNKKAITINVSHICNDSVEENISTILHEVFHVYEYHVVSILNFDSDDVQNSYYFEDARRWYDNINNYCSGTEDFAKYKAQPLEADANAHAQKRTAQYLLFAQYCKTPG